jgi:hypothetical protein
MWAAQGAAMQKPASPDFLSLILLKDDFNPQRKLFPGPTRDRDVRSRGIPGSGLAGRQASSQQRRSLAAGGGALGETPPPACGVSPAPSTP